MWCQLKIQQVTYESPITHGLKVTANQCQEKLWGHLRNLVTRNECVKYEIRIIKDSKVMTKVKLQGQDQEV